MKYLIRAVKYFLYICFLISITITVLVLCELLSSDINVMFINGWKSVGLIAAAFAGASALYPLFGYTKRSVEALGEQEELKDSVIAYMESRNYLLEKREEGVMYFRSKSIANRIARVWEDRITITDELGAFRLEGLSKDVTRLASGLKYKLRTTAED